MSQFFKTLYFQDYPAEETAKKSITLAFSNKDSALFELVDNLSCEDIRSLINLNSYKGLKEAAEKDYLPINTFCIRELKRKTKYLNNNNNFIDPIHATFKSSKDIPLQRWYPFLEGYSPKFVEAVIRKYFPSPGIIYDPFSGSGTSAITASSLGHKSIFSEINPFLQFLTEVKILALSIEDKQRKLIIDFINTIIPHLKEHVYNAEPDNELNYSYKAIFDDSAYFDSKTYKLILKSRSFISKIACIDYVASQFILTAFLASLIPCSFLIRAGDLRFKTKDEIKEIDYDFIEYAKNKLNDIVMDINNLNKINHAPLLITSDVKQLINLPFLNIDSVITSPPYLNGTNYFRNTKIELWYLKCLRTDYDLSEFRKKSITAGINDVTKQSAYNTKFTTLAIRKLIKSLETNAYDQRIPLMVDYYFKDMHEAFLAIYNHLKTNGRVAIDIGDSVYSGIHVKTDQLLAELLESIGFTFINEILLRGRRSKNGEKLRQVLMVFEKKKNKSSLIKRIYPWKGKWVVFKNDLPHRTHPYSKRNWGHELHSLCSYQGKMKPSLIYHLIDTFVPPNGAILDPFVGVGTTTLESALSGRKSFGFEISPAAEAIAKAKAGIPDKNECIHIMKKLENYIKSRQLSKEDYFKAKLICFNKNISEYYENNTFKEIILARKYFISNPPLSVSENLIFSSLLHILHGNRPYALSRRSHGITPFAPSGPFIYKSLIDKLKQKVFKCLAAPYPDDFVNSNIFHQDATSFWPQIINNLDAVITSPPFFDSTRFYLANWIRLWFSGWEFEDFKNKPKYFLDDRQKISLKVYEPVFRQARERMKNGAVFVMHLGKSRKCDMANEIAKIADKWFRVYDIFSENVEDCESHGIRDKGTVTNHQYLILI
ncbi:MAG: adenine-specific DNA modification methyltransferase [Candidatus Saganbacteria bacterium]|uniref:site-specific DNA-methyltransferase (cytosine-N(4)-specific) n=1 Tax=Candidatus Saganbacteria bacterium TaxID=2575572 RepID=A0A833NYQ7_UNCSA|nr:MAG: adenine-specific DNA modification methyltransferase [Candidatus Saganbacteria bacterium]